MSEQVRDSESYQKDLKISDDETHEKTATQPPVSNSVQIQDSDQESETTYEDSVERASVPSSETTDNDGLTSSSGWVTDDFFSASEEQESEKRVERKKSGLSARMEYLARPKKDFLDVVGFERLDGDLPEKALPSWPILPLPTKLPVGRYPYEITMTKLGENIFLPPPGDGMDLGDENNLRPPMKIYHSLLDSHLKAHFKKEKIRKHLVKNGYATKSGRLICALGDINEYREYTRRILAERVQQMYRKKQEEEEKERRRRMKQKMDEEEEKWRNTRAQTNLRSYIKNAVSSIQERTMEDQRELDRKILNKQIRLQMKWTQRARAKEERYQKLYFQHKNEKYEREEKRRFIELEMARRDVEHIEKICRKREKEKLERRHKLEDFWLRKAEKQIEWMEKGLELEEKWFKDREAKIAWRKTQAVAPHIKCQKPQTKQGKGTAEIDERTIDAILKEEEVELTLDEILRKATDETKEENIAIESPKDKAIMAEPDAFIGGYTEESPSETLEMKQGKINNEIELEEKIITGKSQPEYKVSKERDDTEILTSSDEIKKKDEINVDEEVKKDTQSERGKEQQLFAKPSSFNKLKQKDGSKKIASTDSMSEQGKGKQTIAKQASFDKLKQKEGIKKIASTDSMSEQGKGNRPFVKPSSSDKLKQKEGSKNIISKKSQSERSKENDRFDKSPRSDKLKQREGSKKFASEDSKSKKIKEKHRFEKPKSSDKLKKKEENKKIASEGQSEENIAKAKENFVKPLSSNKLRQKEQKNKIAILKEDIPKKSQSEQKQTKKSPSFETGKLRKQLSKSGSAQKKLSLREKESAQNLNSDKPKSEQKLKETTAEKEEGWENKGVMAVPDTFIRSASSESTSKSDETKQKD